MMCCMYVFREYFLCELQAWRFFEKEVSLRSSLVSGTAGARHTCTRRLLYVCMYVCMYVRMYVCTYVCMYVCMCVYVYVYMYMYMYMHIATHTYIYTYIHVTLVNRCIYMHI